MSITKVLESVERLHGDARAQRRSHESYTTWLLRRNAESLSSGSIIKKIADDEVR